MAAEHNEVSSLEYRHLNDDDLAKMYNDHLIPELQSLIEDELDYVTNTSNASAALYHTLKSFKGPGAVNWAGFYFVRANPKAASSSSPSPSSSALSSSAPEQQQHHRVPQRADQPHVLALGPFQGKTACLRIPFGRGVCGAAAQTRTTQLVPDVHAFPGHIACDSASNSEIVVPILDADGVLRGIIDIDCPVKNGFNHVDQAGLEKIADMLGRQCQWPAL